MASNKDLLKSIISAANSCLESPRVEDLVKAELADLDEQMWAHVEELGAD